MKKLEAKFSSLQVVKIIERLGNQKVNQLPNYVCFKINDLFVIKICYYSTTTTTITTLQIKQQVSLSHESELLTRERLCCGLSIFEYMLSKIKTLSVESLQVDPTQQQPSNGVMNVDENTEFHRIWSAVQFIYCMPRQGNAYLAE